MLPRIDGSRFLNQLIGAFGSRYVKKHPDHHFAKGVAVDFGKTAKTSSKTPLQFRTVSVNTCACSLTSRWCSGRTLLVF